MSSRTGFDGMVFIYVLFALLGAAWFVSAEVFAALYAAVHPAVGALAVVGTFITFLLAVALSAYYAIVVLGFVKSALELVEAYTRDDVRVVKCEEMEADSDG